MSDQTTTPTASPADATPVEKFPFWGFFDVLVMTGLAVPCVLMAWLVVNLGFNIGPDESAQRPVPTLVFQTLLWLFWFGCLGFWMRIKYDRRLREALRWTPPSRGMPFYIVLGLFQAVVILLVGVLLQAPDIDMPLKQLLSDRMSLLLVGAFAVTLGPAAEELSFRGFLLPVFVHRLGAVAAVAVTSLVFALMHGFVYAWSWKHLLLITLAGCFFGAVRVISGSTAAAAAAHAGYNTTFLILAFLAQQEEFAF